MLWVARRGALFVLLLCVRITPGHLVPAISPAHRSADRCPARPQCPSTFAERLRDLNARACEARRTAEGPIRFAEHLRADNRQADRATRLAGHQIRPNEACPPGRSANIADPAVAVLSTSRAELPRLGDVPVSVRPAVVERIEVAYSVRNLLSRGAIIDLMG